MHSLLHTHMHTHTHQVKHQVMMGLRTKKDGAHAEGCIAVITLMI